MPPKGENETDLEQDYKNWAREHGERPKYEFSSYAGGLPEIEKMRYRKVYKCRLCGKEFYGDKYCKTKVRSEQDIHLFPETHNCENGDISFADFLGLRKVNEDD